MKKKLFTFLTLMLCVCSGAWADHTVTSSGTTVTETWDFGEYTTQVTLADDNKTITYEGLTLVGSGTAGYTSDYVSASGGFHMNGSSSSSTRHIKFIPSYNGTLTVSYRSNNNNATYRITAIGTAVSTFSKAEDAPVTVLAYGFTDGATVKTIEASLNAGTTYYVFFANGGQNIPSLSYVYELPAPTAPTVSTEGSVAGATSFTISSANATAIYYVWSEGSTVPDAGDASYTSASGASVVVTAPNVTGTRYLHTYGSNATGSTDIATFTYSLTTSKLTAGLAYANASIVKYIGAANFTNTLTNPNNLTVTYSISNNGTGSSINSSTGEVTLGSVAGTETITASSEANSDYLAGEATYTLVVEEDLRSTTLYSWNAGTETGGTITCPNKSANIGSEYILNAGKKDTYTSDNYIKLVLNKTLKAGDQIRVTGYRNRDGDNKASGFACTFSKDGGETLVSSTSMLACATGYEFPNINPGAGTDSNKGTSAVTLYFTVPASAAGSNAILITRSHTSTNTYFNKIVVYRPTIALKATLNTTGLLTATEVSETANFNFGVSSNNERVDAVSSDAVVTLMGKYHNDHGCTGLNVVAQVAGAVKITIGQCTYSKSQVTIKNSSSENVALLKPNTPACWKNSTSNVDVFYYTGAATTLTISGMTYCPYVAIEEVDAEDAVIAITPANEKSTYVSTMPLDFSSVDGLKAYRASAATNGSVTLTEVTTVPPATPLVLIGTASTKYNVPVSSSLTAVGDNLLLAGDGTTTFDGSTYDYILFSDGLFYQIGEGTVATTKAYLHCASDPTAGASSRSLAIRFGSEATGISAVASEQAKDNTVYNLKGQRVAQPAKGLYIVNGKKIVIK